MVKPLRLRRAAGAGAWPSPAVKCRGREYLRIIYGPEYDGPENLERLRARGLGAKRSLALREFALGVEALERFVAGEPPAASTSASSPCSRWRASRSTRGCEKNGMGFGYPQVKACRYVEVGPETYRRPDFLRRPDAGVARQSG